MKVVYGKGLHLVLGKSQAVIEEAMYDLRVHFDKERVSCYLNSTFGNGLHWEKIKQELDYFKNNQRYDICFFGTMNPGVMDRFEFKSADDAQDRILLAGPFRNMNRDQAVRFWRSYEAGISHVSEILRIEGIW